MPKTASALVSCVLKRPPLRWSANWRKSFSANSFAMSDSGVLSAHLAKTALPCDLTIETSHVADACHLNENAQEFEALKLSYLLWRHSQSL